jgi:putative membrane protein
MAWTRTATSLISFGFTIYKFFQYLRDEQQLANPGAIGPRGFGLLMICIGLTALAFATVEHRRNMNGLRTSYGPAPYSLAAIVAGLIATLGVAGMLAVLFRL